jgi:lipopolysaccharide/colanic/teichoic acid biosynthesis glycosyltransferase
MATRATGHDQGDPFPRRGAVTPGPGGDLDAQPTTSANLPAQVAWSEPHFLYWPVKRIFDIVVAVIAILLLLVILLPVSVLILLEDGGPPIYRGEAVGFLGRRFKVYKLRTMRKDAEEYLEQHPDVKVAFLEQFKLPADPRVHRVGRFLRQTSLDELPQAINVLLGDMSWVGPRYVKPEELERHGTFASVRLQMRPGVTGLWQIRGRSNLPYPLRTVYDRTYYYSRSLWTDLKIFSLTIPAILRRDGAI